MRLSKIVGVWAMVAGLLFWNGALGLGVFNPVLGREAGEMMTLFIGISIVFGASRPFFIAEPSLSRAQALRVSGVWLLLTLLFEILFGRVGMLAGPRLAPTYGMWDGPFWPLIVMCAATAPVVWLRRTDLPVGRVTK